MSTIMCSMRARVVNESLSFHPQRRSLIHPLIYPLVNTYKYTVFKLGWALVQRRRVLRPRVHRGMPSLTNRRMWPLLMDVGTLLECIGTLLRKGRRYLPPNRLLRGIFLSHLGRYWLGFGCRLPCSSNGSKSWLWGGNRFRVCGLWIRVEQRGQGHSGRLRRWRWRRLWRLWWWLVSSSQWRSQRCLWI